MLLSLQSSLWHPSHLSSSPLSRHIWRGHRPPWVVGLQLSTPVLPTGGPGATRCQTTFGATSPITPNKKKKMCSRKRKILFIFVSVAGTSILGTRGTVDPDPLSWALSKQQNLSAESEGPGQETGARSSAAIRRAANWESGDLGAAPGCAIINKLCDLGGGR